MNRAMILGSRVDLISCPEAIKAINSYIIAKGKRGMKMVVTAYSEFYVQATRDAEFRSILNSSDLVVPDGVSILAAVRYGERNHVIPAVFVISAKAEIYMEMDSRLRGNDGLFVGMANGVRKIIFGLQVGVDILRGRVGESVTGVYLFDELTKLAAKEGYRVFLLGSKPGVVKKTAEKLKILSSKLEIEYDEGEERVGKDPKKAAEVIKKINDFKPDLLFVAYNPIKQEKWLWENKDILKAKVGMGVGGTFDEFIGSVPKAPAFMVQMGLKWLWRLILQPSRLPRIIRAVIVFPWLVFKESLKG